MDPAYPAVATGASNIWWAALFLRSFLTPVFFSD